MRLIIFLLPFLTSLSILAQEVRNKSTSQGDLEYYNLRYNKLYDDNSTIIKIAVPNNFTQVLNNQLSSNTVAQFEYLNSSAPSGCGLYNINIEKIESRNTIKFDNERDYLEIIKKGFYDEFKGDYKEINKLFSTSIFKNFRIADIEYDIKINGKFYHKQIRYFIDLRLGATDFENSNVTSFHYYTLHNKRKYSVNISYYGNDKGISEVVGLFNSIAESIKIE
jgi:hypothetical protein